MKLIMCFIIIIFMIACTNNGNHEPENNIKTINDPNPNTLNIAKDLLIPCIGEWSFNHALITGLLDWNLHISNNSYFLECKLTDYNGSQLSWGIEKIFLGSMGDDEYSRLNCACGDIKGEHGRCASASDMNCYPLQGDPCNLDCTKTLSDAEGWIDLYGVSGNSIYNMLTIPNLIVIYN